MTFRSEKFRMATRTGISVEMRLIFKGFLFFFCQREIKDITDLDRPKNCSQSTGQPRSQGSLLPVATERERDE